jgi:Universal stress protein UspA and related nucleotide-binding proteins
MLMIKILIPTDFSEASKKAIYYGMHLAKKLEAEIHLVNMIHVETFTHAAVAVHMTIVEEQVRKMAQREMEKLVSELGKQFSTLRLITAILQGEYLHHTLRSYANETGQDLIIMGTRGASGILGDILGSNAADMIAHSSVPVLAIPPESVYEPNSKIILTTDFKNLEPKLRIMAPLVVILQSDLILFHVSTDGSNTVQEGRRVVQAT